MTKEYKVIVEDSSPRSDLEGRLETRMNNLTVDGWKLSGIFQGTAGIIVLMERDSAFGKKKE
ncbi:MAG: hypothetical protein PXY39_09660 [archaeon]|jgi:hypothetical protein|nr:hypothetical protein [archaeon]